MQVAYGNYTHDEGEVELKVTKTPLRTEANTVYASLERWELNGILIASSEAAMDTAVGNLEDAYAVDGYDLALKLTGGSNSQLFLDSSACNGGTKVVQRPSYPDFRGAAYTGYLPYSIVVEGEVIVTGRSTNLISFTETISRSGGGPRYGIRETLNGPPVKQLLRRFTKYIATQTGSAVGLYGYPSVPSAIVPSAVLEQPQISYKSPQRVGSTGSGYDYTNYEVQWTYTMESATPILGGPNIWGRTYF